tara:strand:+ start:2959 stop:3558 length:600 start_codon:yes stop_codon:yes gene_type:complete
MEPYEIIGAPFTLWLAPVGEAFPLIDAAPAGNWIKVGTNGDRNYSDDGVTVAHSQSLEKARPVGSTGPVKAWRTEEDLMIRLSLWDMTLEQYAKALNDVEITTTAAGSGTAGFKAMGLSQGQEVTTYALLVRGISAYGGGYAAQYEVPRCYQSGNPEPVLTKGKPAALDLEFTALEDLDTSSDAERFGRLVMQHQAPLA